MGLFKSKKKDKPEETKSISFEEKDIIDAVDPEKIESKEIIEEKDEQEIKEIPQDAIVRAINDLTIRVTNLESTFFRRGL